MRTSDIKNLLWDIGKRYPRFAGLLQKRVGNDTQGNIWANDLASMDLDSGYLTDVCDDYARLHRDLPDPIDNIVKEIRDEVRRRQYQDEERLRLHMQANRPKAGEVMATVKNFRVGNVAIQLAELTREKKITASQNEKFMDALCDWEFHDADQPSFVTVSQDGKVSLDLGTVGS